MGNHDSSQSPSTRATLLVRLREGQDREAWTTFAELYTPLVYRFCRRRALQDADALDITQQVLAIVYRTINRFEYDRERGQFRNWLGVVTVREIVRHVRKQRRVGEAAAGAWGDQLGSLAAAAVDPVWVEEYNGYMFERALARIRPEFDEDVWRAFEMTWLGNVKPKEAGEQIGKQSAWVYKARYKILQRLRKELQQLASDAAIFS